MLLNLRSKNYSWLIFAANSHTPNQISLELWRSARTNILTYKNQPSLEETKIIIYIVFIFDKLCLYVTLNFIDL